MKFVVMKSKHNATAVDLVKMRVEKVFIFDLTRNSIVFQHPQPVYNLTFL
jgi:hypothetical protein